MTQDIIPYVLLIVDPAACLLGLNFSTDFFWKYFGENTSQFKKAFTWGFNFFASFIFTKFHAFRSDFL